MRVEPEREFSSWNGKIIALDIGGVCISLHFDKCLRVLELEYDSTQATRFMDAGRKLGCGSISESEWLDIVSDILEGGFSQSYIRNAWNMILGNSISGMKDAVEFLSYSKGYRFAYLSDTSSMHMAHFFRTNDFCHLVGDGIFSYKVGVHKPDAMMYETFERKLGVPCFYTDDTQKNIDAAIVRGWRAEHFTDSEKFLKSVLAINDF